METGTDLPQPDAVAREHSGRVRAAVEARLAAAGGFLSFADYMDLVLYAPGLGYYSAGAQKFGPDGDFVTAPELGAAFAGCLARVARATLGRLGGGVVLEAGGGSGALAAGLLAAMADDPPERYLLLEVSGELRERQRRTIAARAPGLLGRVAWLDDLPAEPVTGILIANEVLDALPVERFRMRGGVPLQLGVTVADGRLAAAERPAPAPLAAAIAAAEARRGGPLADGQQGEISLRQEPWLRAFLGALGRGLALCIDYGGSTRELLHPDRRDGTLACHYRHRRHDDPFFMPGLQDLTAWVDFSAAAATARAAGLDLAAYATQAHVLLAAGILEAVPAAGPGHRRTVQEVQRLLLPGEMGERFKVLALARDFTPDFPLAVRDLRDRL
jgi:SAM-dependent MidA family methyltransferase